MLVPLFRGYCSPSFSWYHRREYHDALLADSPPALHSSGLGDLNVVKHFSEVVFLVRCARWSSVVGDSHVHVWKHTLSYPPPNYSTHRILLPKRTVLRWTAKSDFTQANGHRNIISDCSLSSPLLLACYVNRWHEFR